MSDKDETKCQGCQKNDAEEPHTCPYHWEINDSDDTCNCCEDCAHECAMDV